jgi:hypothetical protein
VGERDKRAPPDEAPSLTGRGARADVLADRAGPEPETRSPPLAYRHPPPPSIDLACKSPNVVRRLGDKLRYSGDCDVTGLVTRQHGSDAC